MSDRSNQPLEAEELERIRVERDLYRRLLELGAHSEVEAFLKDALALLVELVGAREGYLELRDDEGREDVWWIAEGFGPEELAEVRRRMSSGIIAEALSTGRIVDTPSALLDPRFFERRSVQAGRVERVLCAPIGEAPPRGVLYLQGKPAEEARAAEDRARVELVARHLAPLAENLVIRRRTAQAADPTQAPREKLRAEGLVGRSPALAATLAEVALVAPLNVTVLLTGESGTGKSVLARAIHDSGPRAGQPFVELNCGSLPESLVESELFGALPGSHSTATRRLPGKVAAAERGTLFLDEIGELSVATQAKLLQLLQSKRYYPLGAGEPVAADVRVIAATNVDLDAAVAAGRFREDLYYRLKVLPVRVPSLAERAADVPELARAFAERAAERHGLPRLALSLGALRAVEAAPWPGNVRQLENAIEAACIRAAGEGAAEVGERHVFPGAAHATGEAGPRAAAEQTFQEATRSFQRALVERTLEEAGWNVTAAAQRLDLARSHLYTLIRAFDLSRRD
ncbi:MAG TPA: sigma-54-dependent Fis family transcriptional regulator [Myxococcota bacterium]|nr:sigma-54-dependent Fis family transcriptional regulator [Myxococcota bacterium]